MNRLIFFCLTLLALISCGQDETKSRGEKSISELCPGVNALVAQEIVAVYDLAQSRSLAANLVAAAETDVAAIKKIGAAKAEVSTEAKLGSNLKGIIKTKFAVSTDFFQQDQSFAQAACFFESVLSQELSKDDRSFFQKARQDLAKNRVSYLNLLTGLKKN